MRSHSLFLCVLIRCSFCGLIQCSFCCLSDSAFFVLPHSLFFLLSHSFFFTLFNPKSVFPCVLGPGPSWPSNASHSLGICISIHCFLRSHSLLFLLSHALLYLLYHSLFFLLSDSSFFVAVSFIVLYPLQINKFISLCSVPRGQGPLGPADWGFAFSFSVCSRRSTV